jgi:hypothetical protein
MCALTSERTTRKIFPAARARAPSLPAPGQQPPGDRQAAAPPPVTTLTQSMDWGMTITRTPPSRPPAPRSTCPQPLLPPLRTRAATRAPQTLTLGMTLPFTRPLFNTQVYHSLTDSLTDSLTHSLLQFASSPHHTPTHITAGYPPLGSRRHA